MELRRLAAIAAIIVFALGAYSYLINKYNPGTVEFYIRENIPLKDYEKIREDNRDVVFGINNIMSYKGNKLIMTTGLDYLAKELKLSKGNFISDMNIKEAAIGDAAAEKIFRSSDVIGRQVQIFGEEYEVKGITKGSNEIYIPYSEELDSLTWQKRIVRCSISDKKRFYLKLENLQNQLDSLGVEILDVVSYREELNTYRNIAILATSYILAYYLFILIRRIRAGLTKLGKEYLDNSRVFDLGAYLQNKAGDMIAISGLCIIGLTIMLVMYKLLLNLYISPPIVPDNLFSLSSYINVLRLIYIRYLTRIGNGVNGILVDIKILNLAFIMIVLSIGIIVRKIFFYGKSI